MQAWNQSIYQQEINTNTSGSSEDSDNPKDSTDNIDKYNDELEKRRAEIPSFSLNNEEDGHDFNNTPENTETGNADNFAFLNNNNNNNNNETNNNTDINTNNNENNPYPSDNSYNSEDNSKLPENNSDNDTTKLFYKSMGYVPKQTDNIIKTEGDRADPSSFKPEELPDNEEESSTESNEDEDKKNKKKEDDFEPMGFFD